MPLLKLLTKLTIIAVVVLLYLIIWSWIIIPAGKSNVYPLKKDYVRIRSLNHLDGKFGSKEWKEYFPELESLLTKIDQGVVKWPADVNTTTDPNSTIIVYPKSATFKVGNEISGHIHAHDFYGAKKKHGGDHFRGRLMKLDDAGKVTSDGIAVMIKDHRNGTYSWNTIIPWPGRCKIIIELVHSSEAVVELIAMRATLENIQRGFEGILSSKCTVNCDVTVRHQSSVCNYSRPEHGITWMCDRPSGSNETCPEVIPMYRITNKVAAMLGSQPLFKTGTNWQVELKNSGNVFVANGDLKDMPAGLEKCHLTTGVERFEYGRANRPSGYYHNGKWNSLLCKNEHKNILMAKKCLRQKSIYFIGDSTMRQWYSSDILKVLDAISLTSGLENRYWSIGRDAYNSKLGIAIHYRSHGNPIHNPGPPESRPDIVDTLQTINHNHSNIIVFNIGAHFMPYDPSVIMQRAAGVKNAIITFHKRHPNDQILLRGGIRFTGTAAGPLSEWLYFRTDRILRRYFFDLSYVGYIDTWEMTTVVPQKSVHAGKDKIHDFIALFLSYIC